jgi:hypothetical protein
MGWRSSSMARKGHAYMITGVRRIVGAYRSRRDAIVRAVLAHGVTVALFALYRAAAGPAPVISVLRYAADALSKVAGWNSMLVGGGEPIAIHYSADLQEITRFPHGRSRVMPLLFVQIDPALCRREDVEIVCPDKIGGGDSPLAHVCTKGAFGELADGVAYVVSFKFQGVGRGSYA